MNIDYINAIPLCKIFDKVKLQPLQENDLYSLYPSLFNKDEKHTIEVNHETNTWFDSFTRSSGGPLELIVAWLRIQQLKCSIPDAQKWARFYIGYPCMQDGIDVQNDVAKEIKFAFKSPILNPALIKCIEDKGISYEFARKHLCQLGLVEVATNKEFLALGMKTEENSWWLYSPYINAFAGSKAITFIHGKEYKFNTVHVFKDIFDYLTARIVFNDGEPFDDECIILNSYDCLENSAHYIRGFGYRHLFSWLSNDVVGRQATENFALLCSIEENLKHMPMNKLYASCTDLNSWHVQHGNK